MRFVLYVRPHLNPLPQERKQPLAAFGFADDRPANPVARFFKLTADNSPSPQTGVGGEGRGEVARETNSARTGRGKRPCQNQFGMGETACEDGNGNAS